MSAAVLLAVLLTPEAAHAESTGRVGEIVADYARHSGYPGIAVAVTKGDQVVYTGAYGDVTAATPMPIASVSKSFTALAVMQLVEAGKVRLDEPVTMYLTDFRVDDPRGSRITVRQLLNQTSGLTDLTLREKSLPQPDSPRGAVARARQATLASDPGTEHHYTNSNYHLAGRLVEVVSGQPFDEYLRRHVFVPLGMNDSAAITATTVYKGHKGHLYAYGATPAVTEPARFVAGSDGVVTTAQDIARWLVLQRGAGGPRIVSAGSLTAMHTSCDKRWEYGMGWHTEDNGRVYHDGVWFTFTASELLLPDGYAVAVLGDSGIGFGNEGINPLAESIGDALRGKAVPPAGSPRLAVDLVLAALTLATVALGVRSLLKQRYRRRWWWLLPRLVPLVFLFTMAHLLGGYVGGGRDMTLHYLVYYAPAFVVWVVLGTVLNLAVVVKRIAERVGRRGGRARGGDRTVQSGRSDHPRAGGNGEGPRRLVGP
jgi:CubicO group peptidase (beta-lactamase class C family)